MGALLVLKPKNQNSLIRFSLTLWFLRGAQDPIPSRTRPSNSSAPMVLSLKAWESRSLQGLPKTYDLNTMSKQNTKKPTRETAWAFCVPKSPQPDASLDKQPVDAPFGHRPHGLDLIVMSLRIREARPGTGRVFLHSGPDMQPAGQAGPWPSRAAARPRRSLPGATGCQSRSPRPSAR